MPANYVLLNEQTLNASAASVTFSSIPQTGYTDLKVVASVRSDYSGQAIALRINPNGSGANMTAKVLLGNGSAASSFSDTIAYASAVANTSTANTYNNVEWYIPNYTSSNNKSISVDFVTETNASAAIMGLSAGLWSVSTAISFLTILTTAGNLMAGSTFSLYGIAALGTTPTVVPHASGGDVITNDGTYWYHAFLASGTFIPNKTLSCDVLVVAGGGGGGSGGGGAGGLTAFASQSLTTTAYTTTVGSGGAGAVGFTEASLGGDSRFGSLTLIKGGGWGSITAATPTTGGSGGGAAANSTNYGLGTSGQGNNGGPGLATGASPYPAGAGGGAGTAGFTPANSSSHGNGGTGVNTYSTWASATSTGAGGYYAGGGGGGYASGAAGTGGSGGGGNGGSGATGSAGSVNTGGAGGGGYVSGSSQNGGNGGSGIVIVRYTMAQ